MAVFIEKKPLLVRNGIVQQLKQAANSLTIQEWNNVVNTLKTQANLTVEYLEKLHRSLFGIWGTDPNELQEFVDEGVIYDILAQIEELRGAATLKTNFYGKADEAINKGDFLMFGGVQGDHILFVKADMQSPGFISEFIVGVAESNLAQGEFGYARWFGKVEELPIDEPPGTLLYVSGTTPGGYALTPPTNGPHILMAVVEKQRTGNANNGVILVRPTLGTSLNGLDDVNISNVQDQDILRYDAASEHFTNVYANKVVASAAEPVDNKRNDIWFIVEEALFILSGGLFSSTLTETLDGGTFDSVPTESISGGLF